VYVGVKTAGGRPAIVETYYSDGIVEDNARGMRSRFAPVVLAALLGLALTQVPLAVGLSRRLQRNQRERERLLADVVTRSDIERRRIAAEVHDGAGRGAPAGSRADGSGHARDRRHRGDEADPGARLRASWWPCRASTSPSGSAPARGHLRKDVEPDQLVAGTRAAADDFILVSPDINPLQPPAEPTGDRPERPGGPLT
jgi:hypothetical protein